MHNFAHALYAYVYVEALLNGWIKGLSHEMDFALDDMYGCRGRGNLGVTIIL
jgi:hypothetical protein